MRFIASFGVSVLALTVSSTTLAADLLGVTVSVSNVQARTINLSTGSSTPFVREWSEPTPQELYNNWNYVPPHWSGMHTYQHGGPLFSDGGGAMTVSAIPMLATQGPTYSAGDSQVQIQAGPGAVTLNESLQNTAAIKQELATPLSHGPNATMDGPNPLKTSINFQKTDFVFDDLSFDVGANSALEITARVTITHQSDPSIFSTDAVLAQAFGKTITGVDAEIGGYFGMSLSYLDGGWAYPGVRQDLTSSVSQKVTFSNAYSIDHEGHVTTSGDQDGTFIATVRFENRNSRAALVKLKHTLGTDLSLYTRFDPALVSSVPEPGSLALAAVGLGLMGWRRTRCQDAQKAQKAAHLA